MQESHGLHFECRPDYLVVHAWAPRDSLPLALYAWRKIADECARHHYHRVLVIENVHEILSTLELFEFVERLPELGLLGIAVAFVDPCSERLPGYRFGETAAKNRGIVVKVFDQVEAAEQWLEAQPVP